MTLTCPKCASEMRSYERNQVHVDQCTGCGGLFLDRGELEQLSAAESQWHRSPEPAQPPAQQPSQPYRESYQQPYRDNHQQQYRDSHQQPYRKKKKSFLSELFDD